MNLSFPAISRNICCLFFIIYSSGPVLSQKLDTAALYRISNVGYEGKSLALSYDGTHNIPVLRNTADQPTQYWKLKLDKYGNYRFINSRQGKTFSIEVVNDADKNKLFLGATRDVASQAWKISTKTAGIYRITCLWLGTEKALAVVESSDAINALTMAPTDASTKAQEWRFSKLPTTPMQAAAPTPQPQIPESIGIPLVDTTVLYYLSTQWQGEGKTLGVKPGTENMVELQTKKEAPAHYWRFKATPNGYYRLVNNAYPAKCLDIINDGKNNNRITLSPIQNYSGQFWKVSSVGDGAFVRFTSLWHGDQYSLDVLNDGVNKELVMNTSANYSGQWWKLSKVPAPAITPPSPIVATFKNKLVAGEELKSGMELKSPNGKYTLIQQNDGNLVLYDDTKKALWASGTHGKNVERCSMQTDGNLVQYLPYKVAVWSTGTHGNEGAFLVLQDDGNVVLYNKANKPLWSTNTSQ